MTIVGAIRTKLWSCCCFKPVSLKSNDRWISFLKSHILFPSWPSVSLLRRCVSSSASQPSGRAKRGVSVCSLARAICLFFFFREKNRLLKKKSSCGSSKCKNVNNTYDCQLANMLEDLSTLLRMLASRLSTASSCGGRQPVLRSSCLYSVNGTSNIWMVALYIGQVDN